MLKKAREVATRNSKRIERTEVIQSQGVDFKAYYDAENRLNKRGYTIQSMNKNNPIKFHKNNSLEGIIITDSTYKDGGVVIVYFK